MNAMKRRAPQKRTNRKRVRRTLPKTIWRESVRFPPCNPRPKLINHLGLSGGKDSTALLLWALFESGYDRSSLDVSFCDTGNESPLTLEYIDYLEQRLEIGITRIKPGLDFWALAKWKTRFPSAKARFCTQFLKIIPTIDYINAMFDAGHSLTLHTGVRAAESTDRAKLLEREYDGRFMCEVRRPLHKLTISDVWRMHEKYGVKPNPLYGLGMMRVGCFPCVMSRKREIKRIAQVFPEAIDNIRVKETQFLRPSFGGYSSFFTSKTVPKRFRSLAFVNKKGKQIAVCTVDDVVAWSQTAKGAKFDPRISAELALEYDKLPSTEDTGQCPSTLGMCE